MNLKLAILTHFLDLFDQWWSQWFLNNRIVSFAYQYSSSEFTISAFIWEPVANNVLVGTKYIFVPVISSLWVCFTKSICDTDYLKYVYQFHLTLSNLIFDGKIRVISSHFAISGHFPLFVKLIWPIMAEFYVTLISYNCKRSVFIMVHYSKV